MESSNQKHFKRFVVVAQAQTFSLWFLTTQIDASFWLVPQNVKLFIYSLLSIQKTNRIRRKIQLVTSLEKS